MTGSVWRVLVTVGQRVAVGEELIVIEAMKMEIPLRAETVGRVAEVRCVAGAAAAAGDVLLVIEEAAT